jgi:hypothetical protein
MKKFFIKNKVVSLILLTLIVFSSGGVFFVPESSAEVMKEYRRGEMFNINNRHYLAASNGAFVEILEISSENKFKKISEIRGLEEVNDLFLNEEEEKIYLIVLTGRFLIEYNISDPLAPKIEVKRDLYEWRGRGKYKIGYMKSLAGNGKYIFTAGSQGVRAFDKNSLAVADNKIYTLEPSYGIVAKGNILAVIIKDKGFYDKGLIFDVESGILKGEYNLANFSDITRQPAIDSVGNVYFPSDNSLIKINNAGQTVSSYFNPVKEGLTFSYGVKEFNGNLFYVNGFGLTELNNNLKKSKFFFSAPSNIYGPNSWATGLAVDQDGRAAIFNKSSILLLDNKLNLLDKYIYQSMLEQPEETSLKIVLGKYQASAGENLNIKIFGFWPNEKVAVKLGSVEQVVKVNNYGAGETTMLVPGESGAMFVSADGQNSKLNYQISFIVR